MYTNKEYSNEKLLKFLPPQDNDKLLKIHGYDLQVLLILIDKYELALRKKLGFDEKITFGFEIEFENADKKKITERLNDIFPDNTWPIKKEKSIVTGAEITSPILFDNEKAWQDLNTICNIISPYATIGDKSGGHIHIGAQILDNQNETWLNLIKLWSVYENIIFRFTYGSLLTARKSINTYAKPLAESFWRDYLVLKNSNRTLKEVIKKISHDDRLQAINFFNAKDLDKNTFIKDNTIEFRSPNGTLNPIIWQNNTNLFVRILEYAKNPNYDYDIIKKRHSQTFNIYNNLDLYNEIYLEQALEFCDLVFRNNLDKIYFLKQYLKSYQIYDKKYTLRKK